VKLGLDLHGVIDRDPIAFSKLSKDVIGSFGEVHVITGSLDTPALHDALDGYGISYTKVFSISSYNLSQGVAVRYDEKGNPWIDSEIWNRAKAEYCHREGIDLHIDDSEIYGQYFTTPYLLYRGSVL